jgi:peroxiredoxin family protein
LPITVFRSDPAFSTDIGAWCHSTGNTLVELGRENGNYKAVIANGAASMGSDVPMFFTFWGINALRRPKRAAVNKNLIEKMFGWMMPRGADKLKLSKLNMGGMGLAMVKGIMRKKNVPSPPEMIKSEQKGGVKLVVCSMSMDLMGIKREELLDGIEEGGVATYLCRAEVGNVNLFL